MSGRVKCSLGKRLGSMLVDHISMCFILVIVYAPFFICGMYVGSEHATILQAIGMSIGFTIYMNKDFFGGRSPAKRYLGLVVINNQTGNNASPMRCFIRNLILPLWMIEVVVILFSPSRRIGDFLAGTSVVEFDGNEEVAEYGILSCLLPVIIGYVLNCSFIGVYVYFSSHIVGVPG